MPPRAPSRPWPMPLRNAATRLGITRDAAETRCPDVHSVANALGLHILPRSPHIFVLVGPSGAGKTTALRELTAMARREGRPIFNEKKLSMTARNPGDATPVRMARQRPDWSPDQVLGHLARFGLAEAHCLTAPAHRLSTGQRERLAIAELVAMAAKHQGALLVLDEFASALDDLTAIALAATLTRAATEFDLLIALATHRRCALPHLQPATTIEITPTSVRRIAVPVHEPVHQDESHDSRVPAVGSTRLLAPDPVWRCSIERGHADDYKALARLHYRPGHPATIAGVWRAVIEPRACADPLTKAQGPQLAGVLVVSYPTLNGAWREHAWPGRYTRGDKRLRANRLNRELRCITRVIIEPRFRSLGLASDLVRHYLASPMTQHTEALAAMGALSPFFERAGMTAYRLPPSERDARLLDLLAHAQLEPSQLAEPARARAQLVEAVGDGLLVRELRRWAMRIPSLRGASHEAWFAHACCTLLSTPIAYAHAAARTAQAGP